jgi:hypothetical protein
MKADIKTRLIVPTDAHYYKITEMLKQFKIIKLAPTCFGSRRNHHQGAVLCLAKTTEYGFSVLVGIDAVNVMVTYRPVVQACGEPHACTTCVTRGGVVVKALRYKPAGRGFDSQWCHWNFSVT